MEASEPAEGQEQEQREPITGDQGQQPQEPPAHTDQPLATSPPPPQSQSGTPLPEDRGEVPREPANEPVTEGAEAEADDDEAAEGDPAS